MRVFVRGDVCLFVCFGALFRLCVRRLRIGCVQLQVDWSINLGEHALDIFVAR